MLTVIVFAVSLSTFVGTVTTSTVLCSQLVAFAVGSYSAFNCYPCAELHIPPAPRYPVRRLHLSDDWPLQFVDPYCA